MSPMKSLALAFTNAPQGGPRWWQHAGVEGRFQIDTEQPAASLGTNEFAE
jgi:hypothetical protein